jgi:DNA repair exonuclease SbcCD ATPase subunit
MPRYFLTSLSIEGFRGINNETDPLELTFSTDSVNSVFADNGTGKSSIFESLHYALYGTIPKLQQLQAQERPDEYISNRFHSQGQSTIKLEFTPDDGNQAISIQVKRDNAGNRTVSSPSGYADPEAFLSDMQEDFSLLDYRTFARFIEESPLERGRTFSALLGLAQYSDCRQSLQSVCRTSNLNNDLEIRIIAAATSTAETSVQEALATLRTSYEAITGTQFEDVGKLEEYEKAIVSALSGVELLKPYIEAHELDNIDFTPVKNAIKTAEGGEKRQKLEQLIQTLASLSTLSAHDIETITKEWEELLSLLDEREGLLVTTKGDLFKKLYEAASEVITKNEWAADNVCPLCETEFGASISNHVTTQLSQYQNAAAKSQEIYDKWQQSSLRLYLLALENHQTLDVKIQDRKIGSLDTKFRSGEITKNDIETTQTYSSELSAQAEAKTKQATEEKERLEEELPASLVQLTEQVEHGRQFKESLNIYKTKKAEADKGRARLAIRERWKTFIESAATQFSDAEGELSKTKIADIDAEYKEMFSGIMQVADIVPELQRADDREDLHVHLSDFHGLQQLSARALLSESFRNALAISVFLAAAMKHSGVPRFIVLDDVTSSFDAGHQFNLMELIRTQLQSPANPHGLQFIILSHDGLLEKYFDRLANNAGWKHNKLHGSPPMGAILNQGQTADRLKATITDLLAAGQKNQAEPFIRQYLEYKLQQIIRKVKIPVPLDFAIKDSSRMVQACLDAITDAVNLHQQANTLVLDSAQLRGIQTIHVPAIVGNWTSHYATGGTSGLSAAMLGGIVTSIDDLAECFRYDKTSGGTTVRSWYRSLSLR